MRKKIGTIMAATVATVSATNTIAEAVPVINKTSQNKITTNEKNKTNISNNEQGNFSKREKQEDLNLAKQHAENTSKVDVTNLAEIPTELNGISNINLEVQNNAIQVGVNLANGNQPVSAQSIQTLKSGDTVTYIIPYNVVSKNGKKFNIPNITTTANPILTYKGQNNTKQDLDDAKAMQKAIEATEYSGANQTSTSSGIIQVSFKLPKLDLGMSFNPNIIVHCGSLSIPLNLPDENTTANYDTTLWASPIVSGNNLSIRVTSQYRQEWNAKNNPYKKALTSFTFSLSNSSSNVKEIPINSPYLKKNSNGTYTISGPLLSQAISDANNKTDFIVKNLFELEPLNPNEIVTNTIITEAKNANWKEIPTTNPNIAITDASGNGQWNYIPTGGQVGTGTVPVQQHVALNEDYYGPAMNFSSKINKGLTGDWKINQCTYIQNGLIVVSENKKFVGNINYKYVALNANDQEILQNGTPKKKAELLKNIIQNNGISSAPMQTGKQIKDGATPISGINLVIVPGSNDATIDKNVKIEGKYSVLSTRQNDVMIGKTFTVGINKATSGVLSNFTGLLDGIDYVGSNSNQVPDLFMLGSSNNINIQYVNQGHGIFQGDNGKTTQFRTGIVSNDATAQRSGTYLYTNTTIDNSKSSVQNEKWLSKQHTISLDFHNWGPVAHMNIDPKSEIYINMGANFKITGKLTIGGITIPSSDYYIKNNTIIINKFPQNVNYKNVIVQAQITYNDSDKNISTIKVEGGVKGPSNNNIGMMYQVNGKLIPMAYFFNTSYRGSQASVGIIPKVANDCVHYRTPVENNSTTITDLVHNSSTYGKEYLVIGQLPEMGNTLPGNSGLPSVGGLNSKFTSFDNKTPLYVLPKSALTNGNNEKIITGTDPFALRGAKEWIQSPQSGWVKYTKGMNVSNIVGYAYIPWIAPNNNWSSSFNIHLENIQNGSFQYVTSQFKYYDVNDGVGSNSNVIVAAPADVNLQTMWNSNVVLENPDNSTSALTESELNTKVNIDGKEISLAYLVSHGNINDGNFDPTPSTENDHLMQEVNLVNNKVALKAAGYELVKMTMKVGNGATKNITQQEFANPGIIGNEAFTRIIFVLKKIHIPVKDTVKVVTTSGEVKYTKNTGIGLQGEKTNLINPTIPNGYHVIKITSTPLGIEKIDYDAKDPKSKNNYEVPMTFGRADNNIVYTIAPDNATLDVTVKTESGKVLEVPTTTIKDGVYGEVVKANGNYVKGVIPAGYSIKTITYNGNAISAKDLATSKLNEGANHVVYTVVPNVASLTVEVINATTGKVVEVQKTVQTGVTGDAYKDYEYKAPSGYKIVKVTNQDPTDKTAVTTTVDVLAKDTLIGTDHIVYEIEPIVNDSVSVTVNGHKVEKGDGGYVEPQNGTPNTPTDGNGTSNSSGITNVVPPHGYHINGITVKTTTPEGSVTTKTIPSDKISTYNVPKTLTGNNVHVTYNLAPDKATLDVTVKTESGKVLEVPTTTIKDGVYGEVVKTNGNYAKGVIPAGYSIKTITYNGNAISAKDLATSKLNEGANHVVYTVVPNVASLTVEVINATTGKVVEVQKTVQTGVTGDAYKDYEYKAPSGYKIVKVTNQDPTDKTAVTTTVDVLAKDTLIGTDHIVYEIEPIVNDSVSVTVNGHKVEKGDGGYVAPQNGTPNTPTDGNGKQNSSGITNGVPPHGYHIKGITVKTTTPEGSVTAKTIPSDKISTYNVPKTLTGNNIHVTYDLAPNTGNVKVSVVDISDANKPVIVQEPKVVDTDIVGHDIENYGYTVPKGYHLVKVTLDNKDTSNQMLEGIKIIDGTENIVYYISKNSDDVTVTIKTPDGKILVPPTKVGGNYAPNTKVHVPFAVPKGYHLIRNNPVSVNGIAIKVDNGTSVDVNTPNNPSGSKTTSIVVTVNKNITNKVTYKITTPDGKILIPDTTISTGVVPGTKVTDGIVIPKGYEVVSVEGNTGTITHAPLNDGKITVTTDTSSSVIKEVDTHIHIVVKRIPTITVKEGSVTVTVKTTDDTTLVPKHNVDTDIVGHKATGTEIVPPKGYKVTTATIDGRTVKVITTTKIVDGQTVTTYNVPSINITGVTTNIVYNVEKITGSLTVQVINTDGQTIIGQHVVDEGTVGSNIKGYKYVPANGYQIVGITYDGSEIAPSELPGLKIENGQSHIVYVITRVDNDIVTGNKIDGLVVTQNSPKASTKIINSKVENEILTGEEIDGLVISKNAPNSIPMVTTRVSEGELADTGVNEIKNSNKSKDMNTLAEILGLTSLAFLFRRKKK